MPEARAILLGRMGKHEEALKIYVYRLQDYAAAESSVFFFSESYLYCSTLTRCLQVLRESVSVE